MMRQKNPPTEDEVKSSSNSQSVLISLAETLVPDNIETATKILVPEDKPVAEQSPPATEKIGDKKVSVIDETEGTLAEEKELFKKETSVVDEKTIAEGSLAREQPSTKSGTSVAGETPFSKEKLPRRDSPSKNGPSVVNMAKIRPPVPIITPSDFVIAVMGVTGAGKSTFISLLVQEEIGIGHSLTSCTNEIGIHSFRLRDRNVFLIDTPGFDDTHRSDTEVLTDVATFLSQSYEQEILLAGIIYLHRITDVRLQGSALKNLHMFKKLCGEGYFKNVVLATTMWGNLRGDGQTHEVGVKRENELINVPAFWGAMVKRGSKVWRHGSSKNTALDIVMHLINHRSKAVLDIQHEMVTEKKKVADTAAGMEVQKELLVVKAKYKKEIAELQESHEDALKNRDEELAHLIAEERKHCEEMLQKANEDAEKLQGDFETLKKDNDEQVKQLQERFNKQKEEHNKALKDFRQQIQQYEVNLKRNEKRLKEMKAEYQKMLDEQQRYEEAQSSNSGMFAMVAGIGVAALSAMTLNPIGITGGLALFSAGAAAQDEKTSRKSRRRGRDDYDEDEGED